MADTCADGCCCSATGDAPAASTSTTHATHAEAGSACCDGKREGCGGCDGCGSGCCCAAGAACASGSVTVVDFDAWVEASKPDLQPPVGNKMLWNEGQEKVMIVGGPNVRKDFHIEEGEELFYMIKGDMTLPIAERGRIRNVEIREGEIFLLPGRIPHSPQRLAGTIGLVLERERRPDERDGLRWYVGDTAEVLYEEWFHCTDLGVQLKPAIQRFFASKAYATGVPQEAYGPPPIELDTTTEVPAPINLAAWAAEHAGQNAVLYSTGEYFVTVNQAPEDWPFWRQFEGEVVFWQLKGEVTITAQQADGTTKTHAVPAGHMALLTAGTKFKVQRTAGTLGLVITNTSVYKK